MVCKFIRKMYRNKFRTLHPIGVFSNSASKLNKNGNLSWVLLQSNPLLSISGFFRYHCLYDRRVPPVGPLGFPLTRLERTDRGPHLIFPSRTRSIGPSLSPTASAPLVTDRRSIDPVHRTATVPLSPRLCPRGERARTACTTRSTPAD